jgi:hypothetical protein
MEIDPRGPRDPRQPATGLLPEPDAYGPGLRGRPALSHAKRPGYQPVSGALGRGRLRPT